MWKHYDDISAHKLDLSTLSLNELCQKLTYIMDTNFNCLKMHIISEPEKIELLRKSSVTLLPSNESHHVRYQIKLTRFGIHVNSDIRLPVFQN